MIDIFTRRLDVYADLAYIQTIGTEETDMAHYQLATCTIDGEIIEIEDSCADTFDHAVARGLLCWEKIGPNLWRFEQGGVADYAKVVEFS